MKQWVAIICALVILLVLFSIYQYQQADSLFKMPNEWVRENDPIYKKYCNHTFTTSLDHKKVFSSLTHLGFYRDHFNYNQITYFWPYVRRTTIEMTGSNNECIILIKYQVFFDPFTQKAFNQIAFDQIPPTFSL